MTKPRKILILGGTKEAAELAHDLINKGCDVTTSLAGRTKEPTPVEGKVRIGGFGGVKGLADYLRQHDIDLLIDATHPFAKQISENARQASAQTGIELDIRSRPPWKKQDGDHWLETSSLHEAMEKIPPGARVLLALGSQYIDIFAKRSDVFFLVRMVDQPVTPLSLPNHEILLGKPSLDWQTERDILLQNSISHILCRNSGGKGSYAKIEAARALSLPVIIVNQQ